MGCPRQKMPQLLYIAASLLQNRFENLLKIFRVHGCWILYHGFTWKICGKLLEMKKWLLQPFAANGNKNEKFAANAVNQRIMVRYAYKFAWGEGRLNVTNLFQETPQSWLGD